MGKPHQQRREEIIQVAMDLAAEHGVKQVTTQAIADRVGIAQPTVFRHFKNRDAIFGAAIGWIAEALFKALEGFFSGSLPADERLRQMLSRQLSFISRQPGLPRLLFSDQLHLESPALKAAVQEVMNRYTTRVADLLREGVETDRFRADLDSEVSARYIAALIQGLVMRWSIYDFAFELEPEGERLWAFIHAALEPRS